MTRARLLAAGIFIEACYLSFYTIAPGPGRVLLFIAVQLAVTLTVGWILWRIRSSPERAADAVIITGFALLFRLTLVPAAPVASDDVYRYVWDGRVTLHGFNPFVFTPDDPRLAPLATADLPSRVNFPGMRTPYPALAQVVFLASNFALGPSVPGIKFLLVLADVAAIGLLRLLLRRLRKPPAVVLAYAWSPLPVLYFALDGHVDALAIPLFLAAMLFVLDARVVRGMFALAGAALVKVYPLIVAPMVVPPRLRKPVFFASLIPFLVFGVISWVAAGGNFLLLESINAFGARWEFNGAAFTLLYMMLGSNGMAHLASAALIVCWLAGVVLLRRPPLEAVFLAFLGFLFLSPVAHPWYFSWLAVLLVLRWSTATYALLGLTALSNIIVYRYQRTGQWTDDPLLIALEYLPFLFLLAREVVRGEFSLRPERPDADSGEATRSLDNPALNRYHSITRRR